MQRIIGTIKRVNGPVIHVKGVKDASMMEMVYVSELKIVGEVVRLSGTDAVVQVYEDTTSVCPGDNVYGSGMSMSVELGPGLIGNIYDGIQRPLEKIREESGDFIQRAVVEDAIDHNKLWHFSPTVKEGDDVHFGSIIGKVEETDRVEHRVMVPNILSKSLKVKRIEEGDYRVTDTVAEVTDERANVYPISLSQFWPIRKARPTAEHLPLTEPLITGLRVIDTLFPLSKGGTVAIPGGFGTGKTMTQHSIAQWCDADIIVYIGCGERGNEMTDVLREFPRLIDPRSGKSIMGRTILIANTSNMPVSAREASIYTGITIAEYYRDMGYNVAIMADSTSRWAEAMRELSGRMEEMPAEEGFPAYLPSRIAAFYERGGRMRVLSGGEGSVSIIGAVSPPGGDFSEPVTQHTKRFVRAFWQLERALASERHYPAISFLDSYSEYIEEENVWWESKSPGIIENRKKIMELLQREVRLLQIVKLVGSDALPDSQNFILEVTSLFKKAFLQQNAFDDIDKYCSVEKQMKMLEIILKYYEKGSDAIAKGAPLSRLRRLEEVGEIAKLKFNVKNEEADKIDTLSLKLEASIDNLAGMYE